MKKIIRYFIVVVNNDATGEVTTAFHCTRSTQSLPAIIEEVREKFGREDAGITLIQIDAPPIQVVEIMPYAPIELCESLQPVTVMNADEIRLHRLFCHAGLTGELMP